MAPSLTLDVLVATVDTVDTGVADGDVVPIVVADEVVPVVIISEVVAVVVVGVDCVVGSEDAADVVDGIPEELVSVGGDDIGGWGGIFHS
jgi:hypothetical protein